MAAVIQPSPWTIVAGSNAPIVLFGTNIAAPILPGLYQSKPYTCLVRVPGPHPDDKCIVGGGVAGTELNMPMLRPELRLVPKKVEGTEGEKDKEKEKVGK
jgi:hypothetical protein